MKKKIVLLIVLILLISMFTYVYISEEKEKKIGKIKFSISMNKNEFLINKSIIITATLSNIGNKDIIISDLNIGKYSLDFEIILPNGSVFHHTGPRIRTYPPPIKLRPTRSISLAVNLIEMQWGMKYLDNYTLNSIGNYKLTGIYTSYPRSTDENGASGYTDWHGEIQSKTLSFIIISK